MEKQYERQKTMQEKSQKSKVCKKNVHKKSSTNLGNKHAKSGNKLGKKYAIQQPGTGQEVIKNKNEPRKNVCKLL